MTTEAKRVAEERLRHRVDERGGEVAARRAGLSDRKRVALEQLLAGKRGSAEAARAPEGALVARPRGAAEDPLPLSFAQERLWFLDQLAPGGSLYNILAAFRVTGDLDPRALIAALEGIVARHEVLRTSFAASPAGPVQQVAPRAARFWARLDLGALPAAARERELRRLVLAEERRPFDFSRAPLLRALVVDLGEAAHALLLTFHHIVADGWSLSLFVAELSALYAASLAGRPSPLPPLALQYADFAAWQRQQLAGETLAAHLAHWREQLAGAPTSLDLPGDRPRPARHDPRGACWPLALEPRLAAALKGLARDAGASLFMVLLAAYQALLGRFAGVFDLLVGSPVAGRNRAEVEGLIGFFVNFLVFRARLSGADGRGLAFADLLAQVRARALAAYAHQDLPFERLVEELAAERKAAENPLFQVALTFQNTPGGGPGLGGLALEELTTGEEAAKMDLLLALGEEGEGLAGAWSYSRALFDAPTVGRLSARFVALLEAVAADPRRRPAELPLLPEGELQQLLREWNPDPAPAFEEGTVHGRVAERARRAPDAVAVVAGSEVLTYGALDRAAEALARRLRGLGVGAESRVALALERGPRVIVAALAVLKAGGAYLAIDPTYPPERQAFMLADAGAAVLVAAPAAAARLAPLPPGLALLALAAAPPPADAAIASPVAAARPAGAANAAYLIYTSGSTGRPNGVVVEHGRTLSMLRQAEAHFQLTPASRMAQVASPSFDISVIEIWLTLASGAILCLADDEQRVSGPALAAFFREREVSACFLTPTVLAGMPAGDFPALARVAFGGEAGTAEMINRWQAPGRTLLHCYGPTEIVVYCSALPCRGTLERDPPLGRTFDGSLALVLEAGGLPAPIGVPGELGIWGDRLARGYHDRPALTAERYVPDPWGAAAGRPGARLYRTGDRGRMRADGMLEFLGRIDHQVKVRGRRIELGEIEAALAAHPAVGAAAVVVGGDGEGRRLVAFLVAAPAAELPAARELRQHLARRLPEFMIPAAFVAESALPRTPVGKLDRRALASRAAAAEVGAPLAASAAAGSFVAPRTPAEELLAVVWRELLGVARVGATDSFFELGGHSLLATRVASRVREVFGVELPLRVLMEAPILEEAAAYLDGARQAAAGEPAAAGMAPIVPLPAAARRAGLPLSFAQERLWFLDRLDPGGSAYNIPAAVRLAGRLDVAALAAALGGLVARHEALRTAFAMGAAGPLQRVAAEARLALPAVDLAALAEPRRGAEVRRLAVAEAARPFDLAAAPLLRATLLRLGDDEHALLLTVHHIAADGWSMGILVRELSALYGAALAGAPSPLSPLPLQYADFAAWQRQGLAGDRLAGEVAHWRRTLAGAPAVLALPADRPRPAVQRFRGGSRIALLPSGQLDTVERLSRRSGATLFMTLLAAFGGLLGRQAAVDDLVVGSAVAGRARRELEGMVGMFLNSLALRLDLAGDPSFAELLARVREVTLDAFAHQELPFERLVDELQPARDLAHSPIYQVMLVLQNAPMGEVELPGLALTPLFGEAQTAKLDLTLNASPSAAGLACLWLFNRDLFDATRVARLGGALIELLTAAAAEPGRRLSQLPLLSAGERQQLVEWNASEAARAPGSEATLTELLDAQAARTPDAVAIAAGDVGDLGGGALSYGALDAAGCRLACHLRRLGVGPEVPVGIAALRSLELSVGLLGILKAGGAYVPFDPAYPAERLAFMIEDSGVAVLLTQERLAAALPAAGSARRVLLDGGAPWWREPAPVEERAPAALPESMAYVIYTSGSTGRPKGAVNRHRAIVNRLLWMQAAFALSADDRVLQKTPVSFDVSVWELFWPLLTGARLVMAAPGGHQDPAYLAAVLAEEEVTTLHFVPSLLQVFLDAPGLAGCTAVRRVMASGEALPLDLARRFGERLPGAALYNLYGPTEAAVDVTWWPADAGGERAGVATVPIGRPIANTAIHLVERGLERAGIGVPGELWIGGVQLMRGYWRRPELSAEKLVPDPWGEPGARAYRTGDLARHLPGGEVEFLGRIDHQVKVRGLRIELGEIEAALLAHPQVREAVVLARPHANGELQLVGYVVGEELEAELPALEARLAGRLPEYMVPRAWVVLPALPLSPSGKVDRKALPAPARADAGGASPARVPETALERYLAGLFAEVLAVERVGLDDSFFALGGSSISGAVLINRLQQELGEIVHVVVIFDAPTVARLAAYLAREHRAVVERRWGRASLGEAAGPAAAEGRVGPAEVAALRALLPARSAPAPGARNPRAVFVLSPPRSGSTLLRVMLGGNPALFAPPELELLGFDSLAERSAAYPGRDAFLLEGAVRAVMEAADLGPEEAKAWLAGREAEGWSAARLYGQLQEWVAPRLLVDKTPTYALDRRLLDRAEALFDEPFYIHLIRHPHGMIRSFEEAKLEQIFFRREHPFTRRQLAELFWLESHENAAGFLAGIPAARQHWLRFEELVRDPEGELRRLAAALGVAYDPAMAEPYRDPRGRMTDGVYAESRMLGDVKFHSHRGVEAAVAERWQRDLAEDFLGEASWRLAERLGYSRPRSGGGLAAIPAQSWPAGARAPLSYAQERLWFLDQLQPGSPFYNLPLALALSGRLDVPALAASLGGIVRRHAVLRSRFLAVDGEPVQEVREAAARDRLLPVVDLSALPAAVRDGETLRLATAEAERGFDLAAEGALRARLLRLAGEEWAALLTLHHIAADGWSLGVLVRELSHAYAAGVAGAADAAGPLPIQYADFALWQRGWLAGEVLARQLAYWQGELAGAPPVAELPLDRPRPPVQSFRGGGVDVHLGAPLSARLAALAQESEVTLFMALLAGFAALLERAGGAGEVLVGTPISGRTRREVEELIGLFVNTLVLRARFAPAPGTAAEAGGLSFRGLLARVRGAALGAFAHQDLPFERLVDELQVERSLAHNPLFQVMFALQNAPVGPLALPGLTLAPLAVEASTEKLDLGLSLGEGPEGLIGRMSYAADLFDRTTVARLAGHFARLLEGAAAEPDRPLAELPLLSAAEHHQLALEWSGGGAPAEEAGAAGGLHELFLAWAERQPDAVAAVSEGACVTYGELERAGRALAARLRGMGVGPEARVAICLERGLPRLAAVLGVFLAGGAYVPLDPRHPAERLAFMLKDSGARVLVGGEGVVAVGTDTDFTDGKNLTDEHGLPPGWLLGGASVRGAPWHSSGPGCAAYVIYTSGSTGKPNGVLVEHGAVVGFLSRAVAQLGVGPGSRVLQSVSFSFDASVLETWLAWSAGGTLCLARREDRLSGESLVELVLGEELTTLILTPAVLAELPEVELPSVTAIAVGGDRFPGELASRWASRPGVVVLNCYGPTETVIYTAAHRCRGSYRKEPPIGRPLAGSRGYVLDAAGGLAPAGAVGELAFAGPHLARGYLDRPALIAARFVPDPFAGLSGRLGSRLYRTGDLARYLPDGELEFMGRADGQVKVRGLRLELGEIEAALASHPGVAQAAVAVAGTATGVRLSAAFVPVNGAEGPRVPELRDFLAARLPAYMVPAVLLPLAALPVLPTGKVDRKALAALAARAATQAAPAPAAAPRTRTEEGVAAIFAQVLGLAGVGADDDFFALGGHSLLATRAVSRLREAFGVELPLRALFEAPTPAGLAAAVDDRLRRDAGLALPPLARAPRDGRLPLSFAQERLWFLDRLAPLGAAYTIPAAVHLAGPLMPAALAAALAEIVRRHEALRTVFAEAEGQPFQVILPAAPVPVPEVDLTALPPALREGAAAAAVAAAAALPFALDRDLPLRALLVRRGAEAWTLLLALHHIAADGASMAVLRRELAALYGAAVAGRPSPLPELPVQYADYAAWQRGWLAGPVLEGQIAYWQERLAGAPLALDLPTDRPRPAVQSLAGARLPLALPAELPAGVEALARAAGVTGFMALLAAFFAVLARFTGVEDLVVGTPLAGRGAVELEGMIGFFVNSVAVRGALGGAPTVGRLLARVRESVLGAFTHGELPFERLVEALGVERSLARHPVYQVVFSLVEEERSAGGVEVLPGLAARPLAQGSAATAKTDLLLSISRGDGLAGGFEYSTDLFDAATVARLGAGFVRLLAGLVGDLGRPVAELPLLSAEEELELCRWGAGPAAARGEETLYGLFAARALAAPDAAAAVHEGAHLSYGELARRAERLARHLAALGVAVETPVAVALEPGLDRLVAMWAIFAAGGLQVPLDPAYPAERLAYLLADAGAAVLVTRGGLARALPAGAAAVLDLAAERAWLAAPLPAADPDRLAYLIYTSGSTGKPNGVAVPHGAAANLIRAALGHFAVGPGSRVLQLISWSFDASVLETGLALAGGGTLCVVPEAVRTSGEALAARMREHGVTAAVLTPALLAALPAGAEAALPDLAAVSVGAESFPAELANRWAPPASSLSRLLNCYGPTEAAIYASFHLCRGAARREPPIGRPVAGVQAAVLDAELRPVPVGVPGMLWLGGAGLARGYWRRPELTALRFTPDPRGEAGGRRYRTGDLVRYRADGELEFLGRADGQVKVRGVRVEVGEVEAALTAQAAVAEAAVVATGEGSALRLVAFVTVRSGSAAPAADELRRALLERLPAAYVPAAFTVLPALPLTPTGKTDRRALARLGGNLGDLLVGPRIAPRDLLEWQLARVWEEVLGIPVGVRDNFFEIGGHSLLAVRLMARIAAETGRELPLSALFRGGTVETLAALLREGGAEGEGCLITLEPGGDRPPFFCVHPAGGDVLCFAPLARALGPEQPFHALRSLGLLPGEQPLASIEEMAARYLAEVRRVQPAGPYRLGGWSLGALVAFEMAQQLRAAGEEIAVLAILDSGPAVRESAAAELSDAHYLLDVAAYVERLWGRPVDLDPAELEGLAAADQLALLAERLAAVDLLPTAGADTLARTLAVYKANARALARYRARRYPGELTLFRSQGPAGAHDLGWREVVTGTLAIHALPGDHLGMLAEPHVRKLAAALGTALAASRAELAAVGAGES